LYYNGEIRRPVVDAAFIDTGNGGNAGGWCFGG